MLKTTVRRLSAMLAVLAVLGCTTGSVASPSAPATTGSAAVSPASTSPSASASASAASSATASAEPSATPTEAPATPAPRTGTWSEPLVVSDSACHEFSAAIDGDSGYHVVAGCEGGMQHVTSADGREWTAEPVPPPSAGGWQAPQIAIDGGRAYIAYSRVEVEPATCSPDPFVNLGVEVRSRELPGGEWLEPVTVGNEGDELQSFRVVDGTIYATVTPGAGEAGGAALERPGGVTATRVAIPDAVSTSLRIGDDGRARVGYSTGEAVRLGTVDGGELTSELVDEAGGSVLGNPSLVLAPGDVASLMWTREVNPEESCGGEELEDEGTYFATDAAGSWAVTKVSDVVGPTSLTLDQARGDTHALVATGEELHHFVRDSAGEWSSSLLPGGTFNPVIRVDPASDFLVAFALADDKILMFTQR